MTLVALIFVCAVAAFIAIVFFILMRSHNAAVARDNQKKSKESRGGKKVSADSVARAKAASEKSNRDKPKRDQPAANARRETQSGEAMYAMMFPDIAPLFQPEPMLEWLEWFQQRRRTRQLLRDGRRWHGQVPGFPDAANMAVTGQGKEVTDPDLVVLQKADGTPLAEFLVEYKNDGRTLLTNNAGTFTLNPDDERKVRFKGADERSFAWRGPGLWQLSGNQAMPALQAQGADLRLDRGKLGTTAAVAAGVAGVAGVAAAGLMADRVMQEREAARAERRAQREAEKREQARRDSQNSSSNDLDDDDGFFIDSSDDDDDSSTSSTSSHPGSHPGSHSSRNDGDRTDVNFAAIMAAGAAGGATGSVAAGNTEASSSPAIDFDLSQSVPDDLPSDSSSDSGSGGSDASFGLSTSY